MASSKKPVQAEINLSKQIPQVPLSNETASKVFGTATASVPQSVPSKPVDIFQANLEKYKNTLEKLLKAHNISPDQFIHIVLSEVKRNEKLLQATQANPASMFASILAGAEIGLIPNALQGEFFLIPRQINGKPTVTPLIGYKGLVGILLRSGDITRIHTECVFEGDEFEAIYGLEPNIIHKPDFGKERSSNTFRFVYAVAKLKTGEYQFSVLSKKEIIAIQSMSKYNNGLYFNDKDDPNRWMLRKTALIQLSKMLPKDYYSRKAVELDTTLEGGAFLNLDENDEVKYENAKRFSPTKQANVINTINNLPDLPTIENHDKKENTEEPSGKEA
jgi:recombination protein RecT